MKTAEEIRKWLMQKYPYCNNGYEAWIARIETDIPMLVDFATAITKEHEAEMIVANELIAAYREYERLLDKELTRTAIFLSIHGQGARIEDVQEGMRLRHKIEALLAQFREETKGKEGEG